ncbi:hypothetical protein E2R68_00625 [Psychromonas sp. RZ22]|uniref:hypothetical protein n=1 Tax=Psychromonas algarum TaxID=2555643 RepID=UPI0010685DFB|nr:hypothetical protein [Psychromonas sp. RZ22]TEW56573.1 hypothetical protein E2R68_00625 [Psychromonas sp. RZ22]
MNKNTPPKVIQALDEFKKHYIDNQKKVGLGIDVVIDLNGIKIQKRIATNTIILTMFPAVIMNEPAPAKRGKDLKSVREIFKYLCEKFPSVSYEEDVSESDYAKDIDLDCERDMCDVFDENIEKRQQSKQTLSNKKKKNPALLFEISKNSKFPIMFKFRCDEAFLFVLESHCHIDYITGFKKFKNEDITVKTNDGVIDHFDDYKMNVCVMFLLNKFCKKSYSVKPFKIDTALLNLMTIRIPETDSDEDGEDQTKIGVKPIFLDVVYESFFEKYNFNYSADKFVIEVLKGMEGLSFYNYQNECSKNAMGFDKNIGLIRKSINQFYNEKGINRDMIVDNYSINYDNHLHQLFMFLFSKYFDLYFKHNVVEDTFKSKSESQPKPSKKKNKL